MKKHKKDSYNSSSHRAGRRDAGSSNNIGLFTKGTTVISKKRSRDKVKIETKQDE